MENAGNLFESIPKDIPDEIFDIIEHGPTVKIERILSLGQTTPPGTWLKQASHEWVILLRGAARLAFRESGELMEFSSGDYIRIASGVEHRVEWTDSKQPCVWLAVHYK